MLDGALTMGDPAVAHVRWLNPCEIFENIRLPEMMREMLCGSRPQKPFSRSGQRDARKSTHTTLWS